MTGRFAGRLEGWLEAANRHAEQWGMVWFGLVFWGSVINAVIRSLVPMADAELMAGVAYATGLAIGALAKARGGWL